MATPNAGQAAGCGQGASAARAQGQRAQVVPTEGTLRRTQQRCWLLIVGTWASGHLAGVCDWSSLEDPAEETRPVLPGFLGSIQGDGLLFCADGKCIRDHLGGQKLDFSLSELNSLMSLHLDQRRKQVNLFSISTVGQKKKKKLIFFPSPLMVEKSIILPFQGNSVSFNRK